MRTFLCFFILVAKCSIIFSIKSCTTKLGYVGTCEPITECDYITNLLSIGDLSDLTPCEFNGSVGVFCCPVNHENTAKSNLCGSCRKNIELKERLRPNLTIYNEKSPNISTGELPHMAQVIFPEKGFVGAGVLVSEKFVLTAAHVVYIRRSMPLVRLGKTTLDDADQMIGLEVNVKQVIPHELYQPRETYNNVALLLLERSVKFYNHIWPACLQSSSMKTNGDVTLSLSGWKKNGKKTNVLIKSDLRVVDDLECEAVYGGTKYETLLPDGLVVKNLMCARNIGCLNSGADSDGPVFYYSNNTFFIYAIATNIETSCDSNHPGIYTKIEDVVDWIESVIN